MKKRITIVLAVLSALLLGVGCSSHTSYWKNYELTGYQDDPTEPEDYYWVSGVADMGSDIRELTLCWVTLAESKEVQVVCSLARRQMQGDAIIYWEDPEGEKVKIWDMLGQSSGSGNGSYTLTKGEYEVGIGITDLGEENVLYLDELPSQEELDKLPPLG